MAIFAGRFPRTRLRRLRDKPWLRSLVRECHLCPSDLILPVFICEGEDLSIPIPTLPGISRYSIDRLIPLARAAREAGISALALFPEVPMVCKSADAKEAYNPNNLICRTLTTLRENVDGIGLIADIALDPYTTHGHDGLLIGKEIVNDPSVDVMCHQALVHAKAGAHILAPSDMMDGRVGALRHTLDEANYHHVSILSYAAKYASAFYGPFRDAIGSRPLGDHIHAQAVIDKRSYQIDPANRQEALREVALDLDEGADLIMIKPGLLYLDVIAKVKETFGVPVFAYHVSGEYAMLSYAAQMGILDHQAALIEALIAFKRAGTDAIFCYGALDVARLLNKA